MAEEKLSFAGIVLTRAFATIIVVAGLILAAGGAYLLKMSGSPYYVVAGLTVAISGVLLWQLQAAGARLYGVVVIVTIIWALWEVGIDGWALMPRVLLPVLGGLVLLIPTVRRSLIRGAPAWSRARIAVLIGAAAVIGIALHHVLPPSQSYDPLYQAGVAPLSRARMTPVAVAETGNWTNYGNDPGGSRFSPLTQITPANVSQIQVAWTAHIGPLRRGLEATPLKVGDSLYVCTDKNDIVALNAETGKELWHFDSHTNAALYNPVCRGVGYYRVPGATGACADRVITATVDARMLAVDARDGTPCQEFGKNGVVSLTVGMGEVVYGYYNVTSAPLVTHGKIVVGGRVADGQYWGEPSGVIRAFDAVTGQLAWAWDMGHPERTAEPPEGETYTRSTPNSWAPLSADETLGLIYIPLGNATPDFWGGNRRPFDEQYTDALVALDVDTGRPRWSFQTVHHDLWDYDIPAQPTIVDFPKDGRTVKAVLVATKRGELFVLDRATGAPVYPVEERPAPQNGGAADDRISPTQPYSVGLPSFRGRDLIEASMWGISPFDQLWCRIKFRSARYEGEFTPPGLTPAIQYPGYAGGMEWASVAVDPTRHVVVIPTNYVPNFVRLLTRAEADKRGMKRMTAETATKGSEGLRPPQEGTPYGGEVGPFFSRLVVPCNQPPFGRLSAVDLSTGKLIWSERLGSARDSGPLGIPTHLPLPFGTPLFGGGIVTQSGLTFIGATQDSYIRAFETTTGKLLWQARLPAGGNATPISYFSNESGRQFIAIGAGGNGGLQSQLGDYIIAFALPKTYQKQH
jgi:quinoprotein glucose dehydrogenase